MGRLIKALWTYFVKLFDRLMYEETLNLLDVPYSKQELLAQINRLSMNTRDLPGRSYAQYLCQVRLLKPKTRFILFVSSSIAIVPLLLYGLLNNLASTRRRQSVKDSAPCGQGTAVYMGRDRSFLPVSLLREYSIRDQVVDFMLSCSDLVFIWDNLRRYTLHPYFIAKTAYKICQYRAVIDTFAPNGIIVSSEYSFTSSLLTKYCQELKIDHINIMHGDKIFNIRDAFATFHRFYVWDKHYINMLSIMNVQSDRIVIELPEKFVKLQLEVVPAGGQRLTYYLTGETRPVLLRIRETLELLVNRMQVVVRPHPWASDYWLVGSLFASFVLEYPEQIDVYTSLRKTDFVASLNSTTLYQGYLIGKKVVIDDLSNFKAFEKLHELDYIMLKKEYFLLSDLVTEL